MAAGTSLGDADRLPVQGERAGLQPAHVQQVLHQPAEPIQGLLGGGQQFGAGRAAVKVDVGAAQAGRPPPSPRPAGCGGRG